MDNEVSRLAVLRKQRGNITQQEIAEVLGVTETTVWRWEKGISEPKLSPWQTKKLCNLLGIGIDELPDDFGPQPIHDTADRPESKA